MNLKSKEICDVATVPVYVTTKSVTAFGSTMDLYLRPRVLNSSLFEFWYA